MTPTKCSQYGYLGWNKTLFNKLSYNFDFNSYWWINYHKYSFVLGKESGFVVTVLPASHQLMLITYN